MFSKDQSKKLGMKEQEEFHRITVKALFLCKRARPDIQPIVLVLCTRVKNPGLRDWNKLVQMMKFLSITKEDVLTLSAANGVHCIEWSVDSAFAVHPDMKSHVGSMMMFKGGNGAIIGMSAKQKMNTDSSTTAELAGVSHVLIVIVKSIND